MKEKTGEIIKELRKKKMLTLKQLGDASGVSYVEIHNIEAGKTKPNALTLNKLARALECDFDKLFDSLC